jgi:hypothetical protein
MPFSIFSPLGLLIVAGMVADFVTKCQNKIWLPCVIEVCQ